MPNNKTLIEDLNFLTSQISTIVRTLNFGVLVFIWSLLFTTISTLEEKIAAISSLLIWIAIIVIISLSFDFLQYVVAYINTRKYQKILENDTSIDTIKFNQNECLYKLRDFFFLWKQLFSGFGVVGLLIVLGKIAFQ